MIRFAPPAPEHGFADMRKLKPVTQGDNHAAATPPVNSILAVVTTAHSLRGHHKDDASRSAERARSIDGRDKASPSIRSLAQ